MRKVESWKPIEEKFEKRMSKWKLKLLSIGGRLTIINSVLGNMGNYWLSLFPIPIQVAKNLEALRRDFFWGIAEGEKGITWVKWEKCCLNRSHGGLGINDLIDTNLSLLYKWHWRLKQEKEALWTKIIFSIHGKDGKYDGNSLKNTKYLNNVKIGDGSSTSFWSDRWSEKGVLKDTFPRLYALETDKGCAAKDRCGKEVSEWPRRRRIRDGAEKEEETSMRTMLSNMSLNSSEDKWIIPAAPNGTFSTSWIRGRLEFQKSAGRTSTNLWQKEVPKKINILMWRITNNRIPVREEFSRMGIDVPCTLCPFCEKEVESISHLWFECDWAVWLWTRAGLWWKTSIPRKNKLVDMIHWVEDLKKDNKSKIIMKVTIYVVIKQIWTTRNEIIFKKFKSRKACYPKPNNLDTVLKDEIVCQLKSR
ncbi:hypothetical protein LXL04_022006 [Taraxacum kok-saghyz]